MELEVYKKSDFYEDYISSHKEYYERENADAYFSELLAEKDKEIAELQKTNSQLASSCVMLNKLLDTREEEVKTLKKKLEDVQASAYEDSVDAGKENRRLKRALWLARANRASEKVDLFWYARASAELLNINGRPDKIPEPKGWWRQLKATEWMRIWQEVERKCRAKAEEFL